MSNTRTRSEHEALDGSPWADFDSEYPKKTEGETKVETQTVDETEQGVDLPGPEDFPSAPRSLAIAQVAANLVHSAYEQGYALGFSQGKNAGLDLALEVINKPAKPFVPKHPDDGNPF